MLLLPAILAVGVWGLLVVPAGAIADNPITLEIPVGSIQEVTGLEQYLSVLYQFIISAIAILSAVMLMFNGMRWATAGGSSEMIGVAKEGVISAIIGLLIALTSFLLLSIINPALVNFLDITLPAFVSTARSPSSATPVGGNIIINGCSLDTLSGLDALWETGHTSVKQSVPSVERCTSGNIRLNIGDTLSRTGVAIAVNQSHGGVSPILMLAMMKAESGYCSNAYSTISNPDGIDSHACGVVQMLPDTATRFAADCGLQVTRTATGELDKDATCDTIIENPDKAICMMGKYVNQIDNTSHSRENFQSDIAAGYNGGICGTRNGKKNGALCDSNTCSGQKFWECEANEGYAETRNYVANIGRYKDELCRNLGGEVIETQLEGEDVDEPEELADGSCADASDTSDPDCTVTEPEEEEADATAEEEAVPEEEEPAE